MTSYDAREFSNERGRVERRAEFHKCRSRQMFTVAMSAYLSWITQAGVILRLHKLLQIIAQIKIAQKRRSKKRILPNQIHPPTS